MSYRIGKKEYHKQYYEDNKDRLKEWREINKDRIKEYKKQYREVNKDKFREYHKKWRENNKEKLKEYEDKRKEYHKQYKFTVMERKYGITIDEYNVYIDRQNNRCAICKISFDVREVNIDHNHTTNKIRGLLCRQCNYGLGNFEDNLELLTQAIEYLKNVE